MMLGWQSLKTPHCWRKRREHYQNCFKLMSIKLKGSTDGSVTLQAPADTSPTGTDKTLILPTGVGSANQYLRNGSTAGTLEFADGGKILQVVQSSKTDTASMTGLTFADLGLSVTITPSSSTSKILIACYASIGASSGFDCSLRLVYLPRRR